MKRIMTRSLSLWFITFAFLAGVIFLGVKTVIGAGDWVQQPFNGHMASANGLGSAGRISDRYDKVLAYSEDDVRHYSDDAEIREALLHVVGDNSLNISTAIQSRYRTKLAGYNLFLGSGIPESLTGAGNSDLTLTVDADACKAAYNALEGHKGACVVYNYQTGEVLVDVSTPSYDPANPPEITEENESEYDGVYLDNVVSSTFTPGSVFKIVTAAAAIENIPDLDSRTFFCTSRKEIGGNTITCEYPHGFMHFKDAFAHSCNCVFGELAVEIGEEKMKETAEKLGFNRDDFRMSDIPIAKSHYDAVGAGDNALAWSGIGQGFDEYEDKANPMLMAMICSAVANGGTAASPYIVEDDGSLADKINITNNKSQDIEMISSDTANRLKLVMTEAADYYTSHDVSIAGLKFCAKTGTAEIAGHDDPTAWFVGFIDDPNHPYAFAAVVVEGGYGMQVAAPVVDAAVSALIYQ